MQRRNFIKYTAAALASSEYLRPDWLRAITTEGSTTIHKTESSHIDLSEAIVLVRSRQLPSAEGTAATVLIEELAKRTGLRLRTSTTWPQDKPVIAITSQAEVSGWGRAVPARVDGDWPENRSEGYRIYVEPKDGTPPVVWVIGRDARGTLFGVGGLLRRLDWGHNKISIQPSFDLATAPAYPIRGHQLGYRAQANSYDAWDTPMFEQYIRELTFFGVNSIEGIPFHDSRATPVMKVPRREMNRNIGEICYRYGLDYWVWIPADFDLKVNVLRTHLLDQCEQLFRDTRTLTAVSFPGGDPGKNSPELVFPFLGDIAQRLLPLHPNAKIWLSLQQLSKQDVEAAYNYIEQNSPSWLGGLVVGPSSPPIEEMRRRLPSGYGLRLYPDLTHNKLSQYEVRQWDQAFALTEGREAINPRPTEYTQIFQERAVFSDGFISYSDGIHDDVNKTIWSALSWDPGQSVREILIDYSRVYYSPDVSEESADRILALEKNWHGPLSTNGTVEGTLLSWERLQKEAPQLETNWRWQMCLLRANYDAYIRHRLLYETDLEIKANTVLADAPKLNSSVAMARAAEILNLTTERPVSPELRTRIYTLCEKLFHSIGLQTSVEKYFAINEQRGAVLDFVDYPLNNRWWLEDEFKKISDPPSEEEKLHRLRILATWENPGPGSFYDAVGNIDKSPHVVRGDSMIGSASLSEDTGTTFWWWDDGKSRARLTWQATKWPIAVVYEGLDTQATYVVRSTGYGKSLLRINGEQVKPTMHGKEMGEFSEFPIEPKYLKNRKLILNWERPTDEEELNWRDRSRLAEVWLLRN